MNKPGTPSTSEVKRARPHRREFLADTLTPLEVYRRLRALGAHGFLFESVTGGEQVSRFSFMGSGPAETYRLWPDRLERSTPSGESETLPGAPLAALRAVCEGVQQERDDIEGLPFAGGLVGNFGWDLSRLIEHLPDRPPDPWGLPIATLARYDDVVVFDHALQRVVCIANEIDGEQSAEHARRGLDRLAEVLTTQSQGGAVPLPAEQPTPAVTLPPGLSDEAYGEAVQTAREYIRAGDIFQVVPARRFEVERRVDPLLLYRALRVVNPSPYMVLLENPALTLVGASPEMLVRSIAGKAEMRPIAGTRRRGQNADEDRALAEELLQDPKECAEHVMLVDLARNDLGRVAVPGGVRVASFMEVEHYSHVMHIVSSVVADLAPDQSALDVLLACFPAGTLSGAPKIRAMEIIDELEPEARGPYGGAIGYLSWGGDMDTCIAIRTLVQAGHSTSVTAGAGIVAESDPLTEAQETRDKAAALLAALALAAAIEDRDA